jgi:uncharacterized OsmC-like protein
LLTGRWNSWAPLSSRASGEQPRQSDIGGGGCGVAGGRFRANAARSRDIDEPLELGGANAYSNPQEYLLTALNACMIVGFTALCALQGIALQKLEITTEGEIDLRGFFGLDPTITPGYRELYTRVVVKGDGAEDQFRQIHERVLATSPNFYNITRAIQVTPTPMIE